MSTTLSGTPAVGAFKPNNETLVRFLQANAVYGATPRFRQLDRYEAHFRGRQYDHQSYDWWGKPAEFYETAGPDSAVPPGFESAGGPSPGAGAQMGANGLTVRDKRPTAPANMCTTIVRRYTSFLLSEARKPEVVVDGDPDTQAMLEAVCEESKFWQMMRAARNKGGAMGAVAITVHCREGKFAYEVHNSKYVDVVWADRRTWTPAAIMKSWTYPVTVPIKDEKTGKLVGYKEVLYLARRIITAEDDIIYKPVPLDDPEQVALWEPDPLRSVNHGLGFFPGVWVQNGADPDEMDGDPDCEGAWEMLDTLDRLVAQMNKGVLLNLDPTPVLAYDPKDVDQAAELTKGSENSIYVGKSGSAEYMEMSGSGIEAGHKLGDRLERKICEVTGYVPIDPDKVSGAAQSAKAIEYMFQPMIERADELRDQYGPAIIALMRITERIIRLFSSKVVQLQVVRNGSPVAAEGRFRFDLPPRKVSMPDGSERLVPHRLGPGGYYTLRWGPYFAPTKTDDQQQITNATAANQGGLIDRVTAARAVASIFQVGDVAGVVARAREEADEDATRAMAGLGGGVPAPEPPGEEPGPAAGAGGRP